MIPSKRTSRSLHTAGFLTLGILTALFANASDQVEVNDADRVLLVENQNSSVSMAIAEDYADRRHIRHVLAINCKDSSIAAGEVLNPDPTQGGTIGTKGETIGLALYLKEIEAPIRAYVLNHPGIDFIVFTKGIPIRIDGAAEKDGVDRFSLDSRIAALDYDKLPGAVRVQISEPGNDRLLFKYFNRHYRAHAWANRFWNSHERFSHARFGGYLVTRLDGYTEADARALITRSMEAERLADARKIPDGWVLLDIAPEYGFNHGARQPYSILSGRKSSDEAVRIVDEVSHLRNFNTDMENAAELLMARGVHVELDRSDRFIGDRSALMGYVSWGSNDLHFSDSAYHSLGFAPGALAETAVSTSARTFLPTRRGQSVISDLISQGITGVKGYIDEPLVQAVASPSIMFERYTRGWTLAESLYAGSALVGWEDVVVGDPITRAYPSRQF